MGLLLHFPAKELLSKQGISSSALTPVSPPQRSPLSTTPKKPNTYQGCRARKRLGMLSFINIIIQGQKEVSWSWLVALAAHDVGQTLALTVLQRAPSGGVGKGRAWVWYSWVLTGWGQLKPTLVPLCLISPIAGLPPLLNFFLSPTSSVSDTGFIQYYFSITSESTTCFVFVCSLPEALILLFPEHLLLSIPVSFLISFAIRITISWFLIICHPQLWRQDTRSGPLTWYGMFSYTCTHI